MNIDQYVKNFWQNGFLMIQDFFEVELMDHLNQIILDNFGENPDFWHNDEFVKKGKTEVIPWFPQNEGVKAFDAIDEEPGFRELTASVLGDGWSSQYSMVMFSKQGTSGQAWHQDCPPEDSGIFNLNRLVYTIDITDEIGGQTLVIPGTHRKGLLPAGQPDSDLQGQLVLKPKKGTLILLHGHTWHRVLPVSGDYRVSTNYRSAPSGTPDDITDVCVYRNMRYRFSTSEVIEER